MSIERERQLTACNKQLVLDLNKERARITIAERAVQMLATVAGDWSEAREIVEAWRKGSTS